MIELPRLAILLVPDERRCDEGLASLRSAPPKLPHVIVLYEDAVHRIAAQDHHTDSMIFVKLGDHRTSGNPLARLIEAVPDSCEYVSIHPSSDLSLPGKFDQLIELLDHTDFDAVGCLLQDVGNSSSRTSYAVPMTMSQALSDLGSGLTLHAGALVFRRHFFSDALPPSNVPGCTSELAFALRLLSKGARFGIHPEALHLVAQNSNSGNHFTSTISERLKFPPQEPSGHTARPMVPSPRSGRHLKILHTCEHYAPHVGGAARIVQRISEGLAGRGHRVVVATSNDPRRSFSEMEGVEIVEFDLRSGPGISLNGRDAERYKNFLIDSSADVAMHYGAQQWATDLALPLTGRTSSSRINVLAPCGYSALDWNRKRPPADGMFRGMIDRIRQRRESPIPAGWLRWPEFRSYYRAELIPNLANFDAIVFHSRNYQDFHLSRLLGLSNSEAIPNGADAEEFDAPKIPDFLQRLGITDGPIILSIANFLPGKGQELLIEAFRRMPHPVGTLILAGQSGPTLERLRTLTDDVRCRIIESPTRQEIIQLYRHADLFASGSAIETAPLVLVECMSVGLPWISLRTGNVSDLSGGIVSSEQTFHSDLEALIDSPALRSRLGAEGLAAFERKYSWNGIVDRWEGLYSELVERRRTETRMLAPRVPGKGTIRAIVFSKDRALQCDALLRSIKRHIHLSECMSISVLYRATDHNHQCAYHELQLAHPRVHFIREHAFKSDVVRLLGTAEGTLFLVDDCVVIREVDLAQAFDALTNDPTSIGYSLRLGSNTTYCYSLDSNQTVPEMEVLPNGLRRYRWRTRELDFSYPLELSSSLFRSSDILRFVEGREFKAPNSLEALLASRAADEGLYRPNLLCSHLSQAFCIPLNSVQTEFGCNRISSDSRGDAESLLTAWNDSMGISLAHIDGIDVKSCHQDVPIVLESRAPSRYPGISIVIPCWNQSEFIPDALASLQQQSFTDWEAIVVDDGSTDDLVAILGRYLRGDPRIKLVRQANRGLATARNRGIEEASGEFILPLDADDMIGPGSLEHLITSARRFPNIDIHSPCLHEFGERAGRYTPSILDSQRILSDNCLFYSSLFRKETWSAVGGYNPNMRQGYEDWDFWVGCAERGMSSIGVPNAVLRYRVRKGSMITKSRRYDRLLRARIVLNHPALYPPQAVQEAESLVKMCIDLESAKDH